MLKSIPNLSLHTIGVIASGEITKSDYEAVLIPLLEKAYKKGEPVRFLYQTDSEFKGYTTGGAIEDIRVGFKYLRLFERCAIVTDEEWLSRAGNFFGSLMPCPTKVFSKKQFNEAVTWLDKAETDSKLKFELLDEGVLVVHPTGALRREDFDKMAGVVDPWIESHKSLQALVITMDHFPGWENAGSFFRHIEFIKGHHRKIHKIALAIDGLLPEVVSQMASHFVEAKIKQFPFSKKEDALEWAKEK
jgi:hypothetical protein